MQLPDGFHSRFVASGDIRLHVVDNAADPERPKADPRRPIVFLHGFPEFWIAWEPVFRHLASRYRVIAPDQRGYNLSDAPAGAARYRTGALAGDLFALADASIGGRKFLLAGHDWGASVAYAAAIAEPGRLAGLFVANGVHPVPFQRALLADPRQRLASQYIRYLRTEAATEGMSQDGCRRMFGMFEKLAPAPWLGADLREAYRRAWTRPGRVEAMLNWYRASPLVVPAPEENVSTAPLLHMAAEQVAVRVPHALAWGAQDVALLASAREGLADFCDDLSVTEIADAGHWLLHTHGRRIAAEIDAFAGRIAWG
jgi:pimeloyl-ACP methyl ester carboxylesterase